MANPLINSGDAVLVVYAIHYYRGGVSGEDRRGGSYVGMG